MNIENINDEQLIAEISRRFEEKTASLREMELMTKELLKLNKKAEESDKIKSHFISLIRNEFNNPISTLLNLSKNLLYKKSPERLDEITQILNEELLRMDFQLKNIFAASEIEAGNIGNDFSKISLEEILNDVLESFVHLTQNKNLTFSFEEVENFTFINDASKIYLILLNLISNACEFSYPNSPIEIKSKKENNKIVIEVINQGEPISDELSNNMYKSFVKYSSGETRSQSGLGLGLSIVSSLCECLNGQVSSTSDSKKTIFTITLQEILDNNELSHSNGGNEFIFDDFKNFNEDDMVEM